VERLATSLAYQGLITAWINEWQHAL